MSHSKRHYRVAERNKENESEHYALSQSTIQQITLLGMLVYVLTVILSFSVGYLVGKND